MMMIIIKVMMMIIIKVMMIIIIKVVMMMNHLGEVKVVLVDVDVHQLHHGVLQVSLVWSERR